MSNTLKARQQIKGHTLTQSVILSTYPTHVLKAGEPIRSSDGWMTWGDGSTQLQNLEWFQYDQATGNVRFTGSVGCGDRAPLYDLDCYSLTGNVIQMLESGSAGNITRAFKNSVRQMNFTLSSVGVLNISDITAGTTPFTIEGGCVGGLLYLGNDGQVQLNGSMAIGSNGQLIVTTGTYNALDLTDTSFIAGNTSGGNITFNGFDNVAAGQPVFITKQTGTNNMVFTDESGSGTQKILCRGGTLTLAGDYAFTMIIGLNTSFVAQLSTGGI